MKRYYLYIVLFFSLSGFSQTPIQKFWALNQCTLLASKVLVKPSAAYSLRKTSCAYNGYIIKARNGNNGAQGDVDFDSCGVLSNSSYVTITTQGGSWTVGQKIRFRSFSAGASVFVVTWYDQSGNSRHLTQATLTQQPRIVNAGTIETVNTRPSVLFIRNNSTVLNATVDLTSIFGTQPNGTASLVLEAVSAATSAFGYATGGANNRWQAHMDESNQIRFDVGSAYTRLNYANTANENVLRTYALTAGTVSPYQQIWVSGIRVATSTTAVSAASGTIFHLGGVPEFSGSYYHNGHISEAIFFPSQLSNLDIAALNSNQKRFYSTP